LPDLEKSDNKFQKEIKINVEALRKLSESEDPDKIAKESTVISRLKEYLA
jgi:hypothetical protein